MTYESILIEDAIIIMLQAILEITIIILFVRIVVYRIIPCVLNRNKIIDDDNDDDDELEYVTMHTNQAKTKKRKRRLRIKKKKEKKLLRVKRKREENTEQNKILLCTKREFEKVRSMENMAYMKVYKENEKRKRNILRILEISRFQLSRKVVMLKPIETVTIAICHHCSRVIMKGCRHVRMEHDCFHIENDQCIFHSSCWFKELRKIHGDKCVDCGHKLRCIVTIDHKMVEHHHQCK